MTAPDIIDGAKPVVGGVINQPSIASGIADDVELADWGVTDVPPQPKSREPKEIVDDLKNLDATDSEKCLKLAREQVHAPRVMLPLTSEFAISFGGFRLFRKPMSLGQKSKGRLDSRDIHPTLSNITKLKGGKHVGELSSLPFIGKHFGMPSSLPSIVFDIGRLHLRISDGDRAKHTPFYEGTDYRAFMAPMYEPTDYRAVMDVISRAVWLFYEYFRDDQYGSSEQIPFRKNSLTKKIGKKRFDSAIALQSIENWDDQLTVEVIEENIKTSCSMSHACIAPAVSRHVEEILEASRKQKDV